MAWSALTAQAAVQLIETASLAPSLHDTQPWLFTVSLADQRIEVHADRSRALRYADPAGRCVHIACGAALLNLRLSAQQLGAEPVVRLLPAAADYARLALVRLAGPHTLRAGERALYAAIGQRHAGHPGAAGRPATPVIRAELAEAAALEGATLRFLDPAAARLVVELTAAADRELRFDRGYLRELSAWGGPVDGSDGPGALAPATRMSLAPARRVPPPRWPGTAPPTRLALLSTRADDRMAWLRAGLALQRVLLLAACRDVAVVPLALAGRLAAAPDGHPQVILRFGVTPPGQAAPRRPLAEIMRMAPSGSAAGDLLGVSG